MSLIPEVSKMIQDGELHEFDGIWIQKLSPETQMAAAQKCLILCKNPITMIKDANILQRVRQFQTGNGGHSSNKSRD